MRPRRDRSQSRQRVFRARHRHEDHARAVAGTARSLRADPLRLLTCPLMPHKGARNRLDAAWSSVASPGAVSNVFELGAHHALGCTYPFEPARAALDRARCAVRRPIAQTRMRRSAAVFSATRVTRKVLSTVVHLNPNRSRVREEQWTESRRRKVIPPPARARAPAPTARASARRAREATARRAAPCPVAARG